MPNSPNPSQGQSIWMSAVELQQQENPSGIVPFALGFSNPPNGLPVPQEVVGQANTTPAESTDAQTPDPQYGWRLGKPIPAHGGSGAPGPQVTGRKPVKKLDGTETDGIPGEPVYTMPSDLLPTDIVVPEPPRDHWGRYKLPHPHTGVTQSFTRATTLAERVGGKGTQLDKWKLRKAIKGVIKYPELLDGLDVSLLDTDMENQLDRTLDYVAEAAMNAAGAADGREFGTMLHAWSQYLDQGKILFKDVPEVAKEHIATYMSMLQNLEVEVLPQYVERIVWCPVSNTIGTLDRIYRIKMADGSHQMVIGDLKTSSNINFAWDKIPVQLAQYALATHMLSEQPDANGNLYWEPMPPVSQDIAIVASVPHTPKDGVPTCTLYTVNLDRGVKSLQLAVALSELEKLKKEAVTQAFKQEWSIDEALARANAMSTTIVDSPAYNSGAQQQLPVGDEPTVHSGTQPGSDTPPEGGGQSHAPSPTVGGAPDTTGPCLNGQAPDTTGPTISNEQATPSPIAETIEEVQQVDSASIVKDVPDLPPTLNYDDPWVLGMVKSIDAAKTVDTVTALWKEEDAQKWEENLAVVDYARARMETIESKKRSAKKAAATRARNKAKREAEAKAKAEAEANGPGGGGDEH